MSDMPKKTLAGCTIKRDFFMSPDDENMGLFLNLRDKGFSELYYSAPYHWGVINPLKKQIINYTEGDVDTIDCPTEELLIKEAENQIAFIKKHNSSPVVWTEGEEFVEEMKKRFKKQR